MADDKKISELTALAAGSVADTDEFEVVDKDDTTDAASGTNKRFTWSSFKTAIASFYDSATRTLTNKTIDTANNTITVVEADISDLDHTDADAIHDNVSGEIAAVTEKTTPVDADVVLIEDSAATNAKKRLSWANIKATLASATQTLTNKTINTASNTITVNEADISDLQSYLLNILEDTTPQLGGDLDVNGQSIVSTSNGDITLAPNGTGIVKGELKRFMVRLEDSGTALATATTKGGDYRISNRAITVKAVGAYVDTAAATGSNLLTIDINEAGTTIMTTNKITIDVGEKTSETAATAPAVTDSSIAADAIITFDIDQVNETTPAQGLVVWIDYIYA